MCGISGIFSLDGSQIKSLDKRLELMTNNLNHRGPDKSGIYCSQNKNFGLSNNRLSIVAPKEDIILPYTKDNKNYLSFNGEIYNFKDIKNSLKENDVNFLTNTDTEVLYEFLKKFKFENLNQLNGMWAFAYYNEEAHELTLSRDLLGERHIFYIIEDNELIFCSEPKPILLASLKEHQLDFDSIVNSWKFNSSAPKKTLVKDLFRLQPGTNLFIKNKNVSFTKFQKLKPEKWLDFFNKKPPLKEVDKVFENLLLSEVSQRIPEEILFSTPLSGGIDSTILVEFIKKKRKNLKTFYALSSSNQLKTEGNESGQMSEVSFSKYLSSKLETEHDITEINNKSSGEKLKDASKNCFDGCIDSGVVNYSMVSKYLSEKNNKVIMFAEGPDELLGGYLADIDANKIDSFFFKKKYLLFFLKNKMIKKLVIKLLKLKKNVEFEFKYNPFYTRVNHSVCPNEFLNKIIDNFDLNKTYDYGLLDDEYKKISLNLDNSQKRALIYASKTLPDMFNLRTDKSFMQHSIEARLPFQAISLVEFFIAMPKEYRFKKNLGKYYLRRYIKKIENTLASSPKIGMGESLWRIKSNREFLNMEDTIRKTKFFDHFPFKKNIKETLLDEKTHPGNLWSAYALINTFDELEKINKQKYF